MSKSERIIIEAMRQQLETERERSKRLQLQLNELTPPKPPLSLTEKLRTALAERETLLDNNKSSSSSEETAISFDASYRYRLEESTNSDTTMSDDDGKGKESEFRMMNGIIQEVLLMRSEQKQKKKPAVALIKEEVPQKYDTEVEYMLQILYEHYQEEKGGVTLKGW
eukprot:CAMPEP_0197314348 /NCGR_PEP_ID=MMETSP0891-20130614/33449_1 /TAXON_ID=44058 ORGANISM="Aureoumbra lagunensis, Strain CCMP1510" /NCGR_SAMPLE_ID=MMETSP0891 /ASSEMBLY_ACC=CAM_ASM_000534 /LENGTH=166 /DNA_ID=CAMNT_0042802751 /DNA_START=153 /DNA_END=650 /DNA_ORIENTATION=+